MTDDIVTQLRFEYASCECSGIRHDCDRCETDKQAADEIERLRKAGDQLAYWALQENLAGELISAAKAWKAVRND